MATIQNKNDKITPCLWFDNNAEEAVAFYLSIFKKSKKLKVSKYTKEGPMPEGTVLTIGFEIEGQKFLALNGGPIFKFNESISFVVNCSTQAEIDYYWESLSEGGSKDNCGWLKDKFGVSWQVAPKIIGDLVSDKDTEKTSRVIQAIFQMKKIDLAKLKEAYSGTDTSKGTVKRTLKRKSKTKVK